MTSSPPFLPAIRSVPAADAVAALVAREGGLTRPRAQLIKAMMSDTCRVWADEGDFIFRLYRHGQCSVEEIGAEVALLDHLAAHGVAVSVALPRLSGGQVAGVEAAEGTRHAALFTFAPSRPPDPSLGLDPIRTLGRAIATFHAVSDALPGAFPRPPMDLSLLLDEPLRLLAHALPHRPDALAELREVAEMVHPRLAGLPQEPPLWGPCHGDIARANCHLSDGGTITLFDFDLCGPGWRAYDVAAFLLGEPDEAIEAFLDGYSAVRSLSEAERAAILPFQAARHLFVLGLRAAKLNEWGTAWLHDGFVNHVLNLERELMVKMMSDE